MSIVSPPVCTPPVNASVHALRFKGTIIPYTSFIPDRAVCKFSENGQHHVFVSAWVGSKQGVCARVRFPETDACEMAGEFEFELPVQDGDPDALKLQVCVRMLDAETGNRRSAELYMSYAKLADMLRGVNDTFCMRNQFDESKHARVSICVANAGQFQNCFGLGDGGTRGPLITLRPSNVSLVPRVNEDMRFVSKSIQDVLSKHSAKIPRGGEAFCEGLTCRPFGGRMDASNTTLEVPALQCHHALLGAMQEGVDRVFPVPLVVYHMYLKLVHSGMTANEVLELDPYKFGTFFSEALQFTCCAGLFPYEKDFVPELSLWCSGLSFYAMPTEDLGWPCTDATFAGRVMRDLRPIKVRSDMSMTELMGLFRQPVMDRASFRFLHPGLAATPGCVPRVPVEEGALPELLLHANTDDCESSALFAQVMKQTCLNAYTSFAAPVQQGALSVEPAVDVKAARLCKMCEGWQVFKGFTDESWSLAARVFDRGCGMLVRGELTVVSAVGLATNASADQASPSSEMTTFSGHCFNVSRIKTPDMPNARFGILEGTAPMYMIPVVKDSPTVVVTVTDPRVGAETTQTKTVQMPDFLTMLGASVMRETQIINRPKGGDTSVSSSGWPLGVNVTGWRNRTMVMSALDSDPTAELRFYNRVFYMSLPCAQGGQGCMPVDERPGLTAGCHPFFLNDGNCKAASAALPNANSAQVMRDVMEETTPPMAPDCILRDLASKWLPCRALEKVNTEAPREPGVVYHRICAMESPCAPEYLSVMFAIKQRIAAETNKINAACPSSDGIVVTPLLEGLSVVLAMDVPYRSIPKLTVMASMRQAMRNLGCPTPDDKK